MLIHVLDSNRIVLDGYTASRLDQVIDARVVEDSEFFARPFLEISGDTPIPLDIPLDNHQAIFASVREHFPLVRFTQKDDELDRVGRVADVGPSALTIDAVSRGAEWVGVEEYAYDDIISIRAGGAYRLRLRHCAGVGIHEEGWRACGGRGASPCAADRMG